MSAKKCLFLLLLMMLLTGFSFSSTDIDFTEEEIEFIRNHKDIRLGVDPSFTPFEFIDVDGEYNGLANDYVLLLNERTGLNMTVVRSDQWSEVYVDAVEKNLDVLPCVAMTEERKRYFLFSDPYYKFQRVAIVRDSNESIKNYKDLYGKKIAVQKNSSHHSYISELENVELIYYDTAIDAIEAVAHGEEEIVIGNLATSSTLINANGYSELKYIALTSADENTLHFAIRNDWPELQSIINKALKSITEAEKIEMRNKWIGVNEGVDYSGIIRVIFIIFCIIAIGVLVSAYWIAKLREEIKKRIEIEEDLRLAKIEAESANEIKSNFLARMSHEIRTPLNAITGLSYMLSNTTLENQQRSHLNKISQASITMLRIINDILDFSKIEAGKVDIEYKSFDLDSVIKNVLDIAFFKIEESQLDFTLKKDPNIPNYFIGDSKRIEQILLNLINNAVKFTEEGAIALSVELAEYKKTHYTIEFSIKDTGIGMSDEHMSHLFEPFTQEDASISRRFGGTGLGLSIVKNLSELMGGNIKVKSVIEQGSEFILSLPLQADMQKNLEHEKGFEYIKNIKTLVLNKDIKSLALITDYLRSFGIDAEFTSSQEQFRAMVTTTGEAFNKPYKLAIVDDESIEGGAYDFLNAIYQAESASKMKSIIVLPFMVEGTSEQLNENEMTLSKPILPSVLYNAIVDLFHFKVMASQMDRTLPSRGAKDEKVTGRILIVEDNKTNQFIAESLLNDIGVETRVASNGRIGVDMFLEEGDFDLILMDLHMPVMNGYEATDEIRQSNKEIMIVAMTADAVDGVEAKCLEHGINHFISKPFDPEKMIEKVKGFLSKKNKPEKLADDKEAQVYFDEALGLKLMGGNKDLLKQVITLFIEENNLVWKQLDEAVKIKNYSNGAEIMHKLKSSAGSIGSELIRKTSNTLQNAFEASDEDVIETHSHQFQEEIKILLRTLKEYVNQN